MKLNLLLQGKLHSRLALLAGLIFFNLLVCGQVFAGSAVKLYEATIKVSENKPEKQLIEEAFTHVLIKVTGHSDISASTAYPAMLAKAQDAISQFRYDFKAPETTDSDADNNPGQTDLQKEPKKEKWFWVRFNPGMIDSMLKQAQLPIWGRVRPNTLVWLAMDACGQRALQSEYEQPQIYQALKQQADERAIPLTFPFLDLQDQNNISATDIWVNFNDAILLASRRYQSQAVLTIRLMQNKKGVWNSQWNLLMLGQVQSWQLQDKDQTHLLSAGIDELADRLARQFAQVSSDTDSANDVLVQINNVSNFQEFQELDDYLRNLASVKALGLLMTQQDRVVYKITYRGNKNALIQEIRLGDMLNSVERSHNNSLDVNLNDAREFKPVILDNSHERGNSPEPEKGHEPGSALSEREKALKSLDAGTSTSMDNPQGQNIQGQNNSTAKRSSRTLIPDLEYWLVR